MRVKLNIPIPEDRHLYHRHHVFFSTANRKQSEKWGCVVYLLPPLHNGSDKGVHFNKEFDLSLKQLYQKMLEEKGWTRQEVIETFGRNYL